MWVEAALTLLAIVGTVGGYAAGWLHGYRESLKDIHEHMPASLRMHGVARGDTNAVLLDFARRVTGEDHSDGE